jgi:hypothetical protein
MSESTLRRYSKRKENPLVVPCKSTLKPVLNAMNRSQRILYAIERIDNKYNYHGFFDTIFIDEKWFYYSHVKEKYLLTPNETVPNRQACSRRNIQKVMFLCAVARPRYDPHRNTQFDGKIGMWPIITVERAQRMSKNRPKGALVVKNEKVKGNVYEDYVLNKVLPAIA